MMIHIEEIQQYDQSIANKINDLLFQLTSKNGTITCQQLATIIADSNSHLFILSDDVEACMGMISLGIYVTPTGCKAWIEDVVVDNQYRGQGVGDTLTRFAIEFAKEQGADVIMLTSRPERITANRLYRRVGFELKPTNVYQMKLNGDSRMNDTKTE